MMDELKIIENFISEDDAKEISDYFRTTIIFNEHTPNSFPSHIGFHSSKQASMISEKNPISLIKNEQLLDLSNKVTKIILEIKLEIEKLFNLKSDLVHFTYHVMAPGSINGLHSDSTTLDGEPNREDGVPEEQEFSALLYFKTYGIDYMGGELEFPNQNLVLRPSCGDLVIFRGNHVYAHKVNPIEQGLRDTMVLFFGREGNVSDRTITSLVD